MKTICLKINGNKSKKKTRRKKERKKQGRRSRRVTEIKKKRGKSMNQWINHCMNE